MKIISPFHKKVKKMIIGHKETYYTISKKVSKQHKYIWVHCASLGEFEQARSLIEKIKKNYDYKILLTFFSPSGYEIRKNYEFADIVCYLPFDTKSNVKKFLNIYNPTIAIFVKYEFWYNYIYELFLRNIPIYLISSIFNEKHRFFKKHSSSRRILYLYNKIFVQDSYSKELLEKHNIKDVYIAGDTRIDRVCDIKNNFIELEIIREFCDTNKKILVVGSSWNMDEEIVIDFFNNNDDIKLIIAPHEIDPNHILKIESRLQKEYICYTKADLNNIKNKDCIIIDTIGILSSIYRYSNIAYIGGGFGVGIHNICEAAVYSVPVIFGPNYIKFKEALDLIKNGGGFTISNKEEFANIMLKFLFNKNELKTSGDIAGDYINKNKGATDKIIKKINL